MSTDEAARRLFGAACAELRTLVETHGADLPPVVRDGIDLTAWLSLAEWAAVEARGARREARGGRGGTCAVNEDDTIREQLAALCHAQWTGWMEWMKAVGHVDTQGRWVVPREAAERWQRQMDTAYTNLPEQEKDSDRAEADRVLALLVALLAQEYAAVQAPSPGWRDALDPLPGHYYRRGAQSALLRLAERLGVDDLHERAQRLDR